MWLARFQRRLKPEANRSRLARSGTSGSLILALSRSGHPSLAPTCPHIGGLLDDGAAGRLFRPHDAAT